MSRLPKGLTAVVCAGILLAVAPAYSASVDGINMKDGKWEITSKLEMKDMPFPMPPVTFSQCLTMKDLIPQANIQSGEQPCKVTQSATQGDTLTWTLVCDTPQGQSTSSGSITYRGESFEGEVKVQAGAGIPAMVQKMSGKRIGPCE